MKNLEIIEKAIQETANKQRYGFYEASRIIMLCLDYPTKSLGQIANEYNELYDSQKNFENILDYLKKFGLKNQEIRKKDLKIGKEIAENICDIVMGKDVEKMDYNVVNPVKKIVLLEMVCILRDKISEKTFDGALKLNKTFSMACYDQIVSNLSRDEKVSNEDFYKSEVSRLQKLLFEIQENFDKELEESKLEEQYKIIELLNSNKYGNILDLLVLSRKDMEKAKIIPLPMRTAKTLVRRLYEFVQDFDVTEIMSIGQEFELNASELDKYIYMGSPFSSNEDAKMVVVTSSGFEIKNRDIVISYPAVQEIIGGEENE